MQGLNVIPKVKHEEILSKNKIKVNNFAFKQGVPAYLTNIFEQRINLIHKNIVANNYIGEEFITIEYKERADMLNEAYEILINEKEIIIFSSGVKGLSNGLTTLYWMICNDNLQCAKIVDCPKYEYRGFMLDTSRNFFSIKEIEKILEQCAMLKINYFHFHFSDDRGYRLESTAFPKLNEVGSYRKEKNSEIVGGYYKKHEIKELIQFAKERNIEIIPELDIPGHALAIIASYPSLSCFAQKVDVSYDKGIESIVLCAGKESTFKFVCDLLSEICELFPSQYVHIGGDEVPKIEWQKCPHCNNALKKYDVNNFEELQTLFMARVASFLNQKGKTAICWNEAALTGKLPKNIVVQYWDELHPSKDMINDVQKNRTLILSNVHKFYCDYGYGLIPLKATYEYEPQIMGEILNKNQVLGFEAPMWTENVKHEAELEWFLFPRLCALAESAWSEKREYNNFCQRLKAYCEIAKVCNININTQAVNSKKSEAISEVVKDAFRMKMAMKEKSLSPFENLQASRRRLEGWLKYLQKNYYTQEQRENVFKEIEVELNKMK